MSGKIVTVEVVDFGSFRDDDESVTLVDLLAAIAKVPAEYHATTRLSVEVYGDYGSAHLGLKYERPETDGERQKRERDEAERSAAWQRQSYERERNEYLRLKEKFER